MKDKSYYVIRKTIKDYMRERTISIYANCIYPDSNHDKGEIYWIDNIEMSTTFETYDEAIESYKECGGDIEEFKDPKLMLEIISVTDEDIAGLSFQYYAREYEDQIYDKLLNIVTPYRKWYDINPTEMKKFCTSFETTYYQYGKIVSIYNKESDSTFFMFQPNTATGADKYLDPVLLTWTYGPDTETSFDEVLEIRECRCEAYFQLRRIEHLIIWMGNCGIELGLEDESDD